MRDGLSQAARPFTTTSPAIASQAGGRRLRKQARRAVAAAWPASCRCSPRSSTESPSSTAASRDFTRPALQRALREVIACMTVYRTYVRGDSWDVSEADYRTVTTAVRMAKRRNRTMPVSVFDFIASVLLLEHPPTLTDEQAAERRQFALKLQQVSGPVAAKGVEDTAFYRYYPLASLNEVGGELDAKPLAVDEFHRLMRHRMDDLAAFDVRHGDARLQARRRLPRAAARAVRSARRVGRPRSGAGRR